MSSSRFLREETFLRLSLQINYSALHLTSSLAEPQNVKGRLSVAGASVVTAGKPGALRIPLCTGSAVVSVSFSESF